MPGQSALPDVVLELALTPDPSAGYLRAAFTMVANNPSNLYEDMTALADYAIQPGDCLEYDVYWEGATQQVGLDLGFSDGSYFHTTNWAVDQNGLGAAPGADLSAQANGQWYHRVIALTAVSNFALPTTITKWLIASDKGNLGAGGTFTGRFREILITDGAGTVKASIWRQTDGIPTVAVDSQSPGSGNSLVLSRVNEPPVWTDITAYFLEATISRGRSSGLGPNDPGTLSLSLDNRDRRFDPANSAGPYYPNLLTGRRIRLSAISGGTTYRRFTGFVSKLPPKWQGRSSIVDLEANDGFDFLALKTISGFRAVEQSGARIGWALDQAGWPTADRAIDSGNSQVEQSGSSTGTLLDNVSGLEHLQDVADAELGELFIDGGGLATFLQRQRRITAPYSVSQGTFSNAPGGGEFLYTDWQPSFDEASLYNDIHVQPIAATSESVASDYSSERQHNQHSLSRVVWLTSLTEALNQAEYLLGRFKQESLQIDSIHLEPKRQDSLWAQVLARELGDRITVKFTPYGGGVTITEDAHIESVSEHIVCGAQIDWTMDWSLSPADTQAYWVLGDANNSLLGISTKLAY